MDRTQLIHRLSRVQGQIEGLKRLLAEESSCQEVLLQSKTCRNALESFSRAFLAQMMRECLLDTASKGEKEELLATLETTLKHF